ncbi:MAG: dTMP kinase [Chloroflexota bacterium]
MSLFITLEGGEGCGKSLQARALYRQLTKQTIPAILTREPGGTPLGEKISHWLKWGPWEAISPLSELLLFNASRSQLAASVIRPALAAGQVVVCDRFTDSTVAYQGYGRGLDLATVKMINDTTTGGLAPDLTLLLDIPPAAGLARKSHRTPDRFEDETLAFHQRVRAGYLQMAAAEPERWQIIGAALPKKEISRIIWQKVAPLLKVG